MKQDDFQQAGIDHFKWKKRVRDLLDGRKTFEEKKGCIISHEECDLGKWLYSEGIAKYGSMLEMQELEEVHQELHLSVKIIVDLKKAGNNTAAEAEFKKLGPLSKKIVSLLTRLGLQIDA